MNYDLESNIISIKLAAGKIDHCVEMGNFLIHLSGTKTPLLIEILDGGKFLSQIAKVNKTSAPAAQKIIESIQ